MKSISSVESSWTGVLLLSCLLLGGCDTGVNSEVQQASQQYQQQQDYPSLEVLHGQLQKGMQKNEVEALLGKPSYSPTDGVDYYSGNQASQVNQQASEGLVVEYMNEQGDTTQQVQKFWLGEVGE